MRIVIHTGGYYAWEPVPADVKITKQDIDAGKVMPAANLPGEEPRFVMKVPRPIKDGGVTTTETVITEADLIEEIVHAYAEHNRCGVILTRAQAVARHLTIKIMTHHAHPKWWRFVEVEDDGPNEQLFREKLVKYTEAEHGRAPGKIVEPEDLEEMVAGYMEKLDPQGHQLHLHKHFKVRNPQMPAAPAPKGAV